MQEKQNNANNSFGFNIDFNAKILPDDYKIFSFDLETVEILYQGALSVDIKVKKLEINVLDFLLTLTSSQEAQQLLRALADLKVQELKEMVKNEEWQGYGATTAYYFLPWIQSVVAGPIIAYGVPSINLASKYFQSATKKALGKVTGEFVLQWSQIFLFETIAKYFFVNQKSVILSDIYKEEDAYHFKLFQSPDAPSGCFNLAEGQISDFLDCATLATSFFNESESNAVTSQVKWQKILNVLGELTVSVVAFEKDKKTKTNEYKNWDSIDINNEKDQIYFTHFDFLKITKLDGGLECELYPIERDAIYSWILERVNDIRDALLYFIPYIS